MDVIAELLPSSYLAKSENTAKDRKNKHQIKHKTKKHDTEQEESIQEEQTKEAAANWNSVERRSGEDRRQHQKNRGRWLDSRISPDRRKENVKKPLQISI
ncbi:hypothetical protein [Thalassotalea marina]|uniref:Uncharacterized protein n=1 Tax=Thalassotalea marina TaxID=1673741 RepID=A0A919BM49_9GAMM|nr:hypothetical protein [Thalassotalea marina]GHF98102.1 hypothetical protein GCM10017161_28150 [Thalassotalea marina]